MRKKRNSLKTSATARVVAVLKVVLENPDVYTKKALAQEFEVPIDTIKNYFTAIRVAGFKLVHNGYPDYSYSVENFKLQK